VEYGPFELWVSCLGDLAQVTREVVVEGRNVRGALAGPVRLRVRGRSGSVGRAAYTRGIHTWEKERNNMRRLTNVAVLVACSSR